MHYQYLSHSSPLEELREAPEIEVQSIYSADQLRAVSFRNIPKHIAIIPDGNRRWAKKNLSLIEEGHREGGDVLVHIIKAAKELGVKTVTAYGFSTENWNRSRLEVSAIMRVIDGLLCDHCEEMIANGVRFETIGNLDGLPHYLRHTIEETKAATAACDKIDFVLALNYGGRDEIRRAVMAITQDCLQHKLQVDHITEEKISTYLDTAPWPDPELLIRTSGEMRLSNFLLWQMSYTEVVYMANVLWPDFTPQHLLDAVLDYQGRQRRLGGV